MAAANIPEDAEKMTFCSPCESRNLQITATHWCTACKENYCNNCQSTHKRMKVSSEHTILTLTEIDKIMSELPDDVYCKGHKNEPATFFCISEEKPCCSVCALSVHKKCSAVVLIDDLLVNASGDSQNEYVKALLKMQSILDKAMAPGDFPKSNYENYSNEVSACTERAKLHIEKLMRDFEKKLKMKVEAERKRREERIQKLKKFSKFLKQQIKLFKLSDKLEPKEAAMAKWIIKHEIITEYQKLSKEMENATDTNFSFEPNEVFKSIAEMPMIGHFKVVPESQDLGQLGDLIGNLNKNLMPDVNADNNETPAVKHDDAGSSESGIIEK